MKKNLFVITAILIFQNLQLAKGQDIHFSQFAFSPMLLNPAMAGANYNFQASMQYKDQWKNIGGFRTFSAGADGRFENKKGDGYFALGGHLFTDKAGDSKMSTTNATINPVYHVGLSARSFLGAGLSLGVGQRAIGTNSMQWGMQYNGTQYDASSSTGEMSFTQQKTFSDFGAGIVYSYKNQERYITANDNFYCNVGLSVQHITQPKYGFMDNSSDKLYRKYAFFFNSCLGIPNTRVTTLPSLMVSMQGPAREIILGSWFRYLIKEFSHFTSFVKGSAISVGVFYRNMDAINIGLQYEIQSFAVAVSYDINISKLNVATSYRGGTELTLRYVLPNPFSSGNGGRTLL